MSGSRVLIVDDEQSILNALERRMSDSFQVTFTQSSLEAFEILKQCKEYAVVVTDMRMPDLDGLQLIQQARVISPDTQYIMLTGNQDLRTVVQAANDGRVFRYLSKPCPFEVMIAAIQAGLDKYNTTVNERLLLKSTFTGVFDVMVELLTASHPVISTISERAKMLTNMACKQLGWPESWEATVASRMAMLGFALLPEKQTHELIDASLPFAPETLATLNRGFKTSRQLMAKIPRLGNVCQVIEAMYDGEKQNNNDQHSYGTLIGMTILFVVASRKSESDPTELALSSFPHASPQILEVIKSVNDDFLAARKSAKAVSMNLLTAGMVLADDLVVSRNNPILRSGDVITDRLRDHLGRLDSLPDQLSTFLPG